MLPTRMPRAGLLRSATTESQENMVSTRGKAGIAVANGERITRRALGDVGNKQTVAQGMSKKTTEVHVKTTRAVFTKTNSLDVVGCCTKKTSSHVVTKKRITLATNPVKNPVQVEDSASEKARKEKLFAKYDLSEDPQMVSVYIKDIFKHLRQVEVNPEYAIHPNFLNNHNTTPKTRQILVDWLVDVHDNFDLVLETLHMTISHIDRYLQRHKEVGRKTLQLVGIGALFLCSKKEDIYPPNLKDFAYVCDNAFSHSEIMQMERDIMNTLEFRLTPSLSIEFLRRYNYICRASEEQHSMGKYLLELCLMNYETCSIRPSLLAAAACYLARGIILGINPLALSRGWSEELAHFSCYSFDDIKKTVVKMACVLGNALVSKQDVIRTKYSRSKFEKVSLHPNTKGMFVRKLISCSPTVPKSSGVTAV